MKSLKVLLVLQSFVMSGVALANTPIRFLPTSSDGGQGQGMKANAIPTHQILADLRSHIDVEKYRQVNVQVINNSAGAADHLLVYLLAKGYHKVEFAKIPLDSHYAFGTVAYGYHLGADDHAQQVHADTVKCPDTSVEFIAFAPNDDDLEQQVTEEVAKAAEAAKLKTVRLLKDKATRTDYLNYMSCPNLKGNFYDGDSNPEEMITVDGTINATDYAQTLAGAFRYHVVNIWLACEAYNDPMLTAVQTTAQSQKYAAGINDLQVGPSDKAAACAMEAGIAGKPLTASFQDCYKRIDNQDDHWGFDGKGADYFGQ